MCTEPTAPRVGCPQSTGGLAGVPRNLRNADMSHTILAAQPEKPPGSPPHVVPIQLTNGRWTWVDRGIAKRFRRWNWRLKDERGYVQLTFRGRRLSLHRAVLDAPDHKFVHHVDGNPRHNWRANLRLCDRIQNAWVRRKRRNCSSRFTGVFKTVPAHGWRAQITVKSVTLSLGIFPCEEQAARARDRAVMLLRDAEFWHLNLPEEAHAAWAVC